MEQSDISFVSANVASLARTKARISKAPSPCTSTSATKRVEIDISSMESLNVPCSECSRYNKKRVR